MERSGAGWRIDLSGRDTKKHDHSSSFKSIKGQSLEFNISDALGLELHHPIMSKLWGLGDQTYRQTDISQYDTSKYTSFSSFTLVDHTF